VEYLGNIVWWLLDVILLIILGAAIYAAFKFAHRIREWVGEQESRNPVTLIVRGLTSFGEWVRKQRAENPHWLWALSLAVLGLSGWTILVAALGFFSAFLLLAIAGAEFSTRQNWIEAAQIGVIFAVPLVAVLALPAWVALALVPLLGPQWSAREESARLALQRAKWAHLARQREESSLDARGQEEFADFARQVEEAKEQSGTLICFECGHPNPVGLTQCEECAAWVPQAAKARWKIERRERAIEAAKRYHEIGESLRGVDLSSCDLTEIELSEADLVGASLRGATLSRANLEKSDLSNANLYGANLQGAALKAATLERADMNEANLQEADLRGCNLQEAVLLWADLAGARLDDSTIMPEGWEDFVERKPEDEPDH
jgi:hypothetical protein